jgi:hypothetical protein
VSKKKNKFDLTHLVHHGYLKDGQTLHFVSDPRKSARIARQPNGEFKLLVEKEIMTTHGFAQHCLGQEPPDHASKWIRDEKGATLYDLWHTEDMEEAA